MKTISILLTLAFFVLMISCNKDTVGIDNEFQSNIQIQVNVENPSLGLSKPAGTTTITAVRVTVNGPDMSEIVKNLTISGNQASGTLTIPKGVDRHFLVEGLDNSLVLFRGETTKDLNNDKETVTINATWLSSPVEISTQVPSPNINDVSAFIGGDGLSDAIFVNMPIVGEMAVQNLDLPRGDKNIQVIASVIAGGVVFDLFGGQKNVKISPDPVQISVPVNPITQYEQQLAWHDGGFETTQYSTVMGDVFAAGFDVSGMGPVYLKSIEFNLIWGGNAGDYRIVIFDDFDPAIGLKFRSAPLPPENDGWIHKEIIWDPPEKGRFDTIILAGIEYASNNGWPEIGYDTTDPSESSFYYDSSQSTWFYMSDGDFGITVIVQTATGQTIKLKPSHIYTNVQAAQIATRRK